MKTNLLFTLVAALSLSGMALCSGAETADTRFYEMRVYYAAPGKLEALQARFRDHTIKLFENHGMENIGYWVPVDNADNKLIYILAYPNREAREKSWKAFMADPDWQKAAKASEVNGRLVAKGESIFLNPTDYSPVIQPKAGSPERLFELRTYTAAPDKLGDLNKRFRDHTVKLFAKHGISNVGYWVPADKDKGADNTLIYIVAHKDKSAADQSWSTFRADSAWTSSKTASEVNGPLTAPNGVKSVYMKPTDYSAMK